MDLSVYLRGLNIEPIKGVVLFRLEVRVSAPPSPPAYLTLLWSNEGWNGSSAFTEPVTAKLRLVTGNQ